PPVLNVAFRELSAGGIEYLRSGQLRIMRQQRQSILQLVTEAISAACLVEGRTCADSAGQRLIGQPMIDQGVERLVWVCALGGGQQAPPRLLVLGEPLVEIRLAMLLHLRVRLLGRSGVPQQPKQRDIAARWDLYMPGKRSAGIIAGLNTS